MQVETLVLLGDALQALHEPAQAEDSYRKAVLVAERTYAPAHPERTRAEHALNVFLGRQDAPGATTFRYEVLAAQASRGIVRGWTQYHTDPAREFSNLWVIEFGEGERCREFTEWWMQKPEH